MKKKSLLINYLVTIMTIMVSAETYAQIVAPPIMGWSSWNTYHVNISDSLIMRQADALINTGLKDYGYQYINIDDGFFGYRDATGKMHPPSTTFS